MTRNEMDPETSIYSSFNDLTRLLVGENFIELSRRENFKLYNVRAFIPKIKQQSNNKM
jgi:hypothetical protein